jgi:hypothetical protein
LATALKKNRVAAAVFEKFSPSQRGNTLNGFLRRSGRRRKRREPRPRWSGSPKGSTREQAQARARAYRWGEDGLLGITGRECRLCFALALWNGRDPYLKERMFGLTGREGNHGEDVKERYFYLDATPTNSRLRAENRRRTREDGEYELLDTGVFAGGRYFDVEAVYAKAGADRRWGWKRAS